MCWGWSVVYSGDLERSRRAHEQQNRTDRLGRPRRVRRRQTFLLVFDWGLRRPHLTPPGETPPGETPLGETPPGEITVWPGNGLRVESFNALIYVDSRVHEAPRRARDP